jgi:hypothetical protein
MEARVYFFLRRMKICFLFPVHALPPTRAVQATGHRRCDLECMMKFEPLSEHRQVGLQASA